MTRRDILNNTMKNNNMIKAVFLDIDKTLFSHSSKSVSEASKQAVRELQSKGIKVIAATGRHMNELKRLPLDDICFDAYCVLNGQICLDENEKIIYDRPIGEDDLNEMISIFNAKETPIIIVEKDRMYINFVNDRVRSLQEAIATPVPPIEEYKGDKVYMFVAYMAKEESKEMLRGLKDCKLTFWNECAFDILSKNGGKSKGIEKLLEYYGINRNEIIAFGDGENDIDMLKYAEIGVAMGNAADVVKENADYVTDSVDEDGIYNALKYFKLI